MGHYFPSCLRLPDLYLVPGYLDRILFFPGWIALYLNLVEQVQLAVFLQQVAGALAFGAELALAQ